jgi:hypothetical protein
LCCKRNTVSDSSAYEEEVEEVEEEMKKKIVALTTTASTVAAKQDRVLFFFKANDIRVTLVDATQSEQRKQLLAVSGLGPSYPQFFIYNGDDDTDGVVVIEYNSNNTTFLGNYNDIVDMNDGGMITKEYLGLVEDEKNTTTITTTTVTREALPSDEDDTGDAVTEQESKEEEERCCWGLIPINILFKKPTSALKVD